YGQDRMGSSSLQSGELRSGAGDGASPHGFEGGSTGGGRHRQRDHPGCAQEPVAAGDGTDDLPGVLVSARAGILALGIHELAFLAVDSRAESQAVGQTGRTTRSAAFDGSPRDDETDKRRQTPARYLCALRNFRLRLALTKYEYSRC